MEGGVMSGYYGHVAPGEPDPWPCVTAKGARAILGMRESRLKFIAGALLSAGVRTFSTETSHGKPVTLYCREDVEVLAAKVKSARGKA